MQGYACGYKQPVQLIPHWGKQHNCGQKEKDPGVLFKKNLKFSDHTDKTVLKTNILNLIKRIFKNWTEEGFSTIYITYVHPHLEYTVLIWSPQIRRHIHKIERVQKRATKLVLSVKYLSYEEWLQKLDLLKLEDRRKKRGNMIKVYKIIHSMENLNHQDFFMISTTNLRGYSR